MLSRPFRDQALQPELAGAAKACLTRPPIHPLTPREGPLTTLHPPRQRKPAGVAGERLDVLGHDDVGPGPATFSPEHPGRLLVARRNCLPKWQASSPRYLLGWRTRPTAVTNNVKGIYGAKTASSPLRHGVRGPSGWSRREHPPYSRPLGESPHGHLVIGYAAARTNVRRPQPALTRSPFRTG